jgi:hypothetical protein
MELAIQARSEVTKDRATRPSNLLVDRTPPKQFGCQRKIDKTNPILAWKGMIFSGLGWLRNQSRSPNPFDESPPLKDPTFCIYMRMSTDFAGLTRKLLQQQA